MLARLAVFILLSVKLASALSSFPGSVVHSSPVMSRRNSRDHNFKGVAATIADKVKPLVKVPDEVLEHWLASTYAPTPEASVAQLIISCAPNMSLIHLTWTCLASAIC